VLSKYISYSTNFKVSLILEILEEKVNYDTVLVCLYYLDSQNKISIALSGGIDSTLALSVIRKMHPTLEINAISIIIISLCSIFITIIVSIFPAIKASKLDPVKGLKYE
jgi:ABC-type lipoprotein release transport system permease subunit